MLNKKINLQTVRQRLLDLILVSFAVCMIIYSLFTFRYLLSVRNSMNIFSSASVVGIIVTGMTLIIITRGIDLSIGSIIALTGCVAATLIVNLKASWPLAILATSIIGFLVGGFNGLLITEFNVVPFIATLGPMNIIQGIAFIITNGQITYVPDPVASLMGTDKLFSLISVPAIIMLCLHISFQLITKFTVFGKDILAAGGNSVAGRLVGIWAKHPTMVLYVLTGILSTAAEPIMTNLTFMAMPSAGGGCNPDVITVVYPGGNSANGSEGSVWRTLMGILIIGILNNGMALLSVQSY